MSRARPIPRISIQAFCELPETAQAMQVAAEDRRLAKAHVSVHMGGVTAAVAHYQESPTPNLILIESSMPRQDVLAELDRLAECCDAGTKVVVVGHYNDVLLYRELLKRGVSEYLVAPVVAAAADGEHLQPLQRSGVRSGRQRDRVHRRQGRRRLLDDLPQRRLDDFGSAAERCRDRRSRSRVRHDEPRLQPGSDAGHRRSAVEPGASRRDAARPTCSRSARTGSASSRRRWCSIATTTCRPTPATW